ncbi:glycoside hydrolase family 2 sugar binding protein [Gemmatirosa kalamazoonensis]|uniref:Glycoside hydrolase family 2 sugar binding protein n=1 Tax=Gemmatirosa kalamazoonensis TaxID=861299 RepID=W0RNI2_9BACT|nr:glycoside hydrolase family 2 sugar binding protein [Gemmatirosa kalamazoonensis]
MALAAALLIPSGALGAQPSPRSRVSLDDDWRFTRGDPAGLTVDLRYDVRPEVRDDRDDRPADAQPRAATVPNATATTVLKPWILPTGNRFIADPARRHAPPATPWTGDVPYLRADFDDGAWQRVRLPHDWAIAGPFLTTGNTGGMGRLPTAGVGWYRRKLRVPASDAGKSVFLDVDGAMSYATVWLNGALVGGWPYGYTSWRVDLTPYVVPGGINQLAIRLDNPPQSSRWYPGAGIYRHVWLTTTDRVHVAQWGTVVRARDVSGEAATLDIDVDIDDDAASDATVRTTTRIYALDAAGRRGAAPVASLPAVDTTIAAGTRVVVRRSVVLRHPRRWGPPPTQRPNRYVAVTTLTRGGRTIDTYETRFGVRDVRFHPDSGLLVNGEHVPIRGVNDHHDLGALGAAFDARAAERQLLTLRAMGANAVRMSHNPPAPELLALTDSLGFLVLDEAFDVWERAKTPLDFHLVFDDWHEPDLRAMVRRDRNSPSVILWSIGNEVGEQYTDTAGARIAARLRDIVRSEDPTRPVTSAMNYAKADMPLPAVLDVIGLNYQGEGIRQEPEFEGTDRIRTPPQYPAFHARFPDKAVLSTETASAFSSRGVYLFPVEKGITSPVRDGRGGDAKIRQVSAYELYAVDFGSSADKVFASLDRHPYVAGEFVWTGFDYLGEPTPYYSSRSSYSGIIDLAGFPKDRFWLYQAHWRPDLPMAHLLPHWTWPERVGLVTPVHVFTSGDAAELFLNGKSLGRKTKGPYEYRLRWDDVVYEPGTLEVVAYKNGRRWATDRVTTAGAAARLTATPDRPTIRGDGRDLAFVTVRVTDAAGVTAPRASDAIRFTVDGPGEIVATDNGDPTSFEPFPSHTRRAFNGLALVIVRATPGRTGRITVTATADGLRAGAATISSVHAPR